jgi:hypothetical protein
VTETTHSPIRKLGFDLMTLIDMDAAIAELKTIWFANPDDKRELDFSEYGRLLFTILRPRPGALGTLRELRQEGCRLMFFTSIDDDTTGERAERWLNDWAVTDDLVLHQIRESQTPIQLDCQAYIVAEDHTFDIPKARPRVETHKVGGPFDPKVVDKARKVSAAAASKATA